MGIKGGIVLGKVQNTGEIQPKVRNAYFAHFNTEKKTYQTITQAGVEDEVYIIVETIGLIGKEIDVSIIDKDGVLVPPYKAILACQRENIGIYKSTVGSNNLAIFKIKLGPKDENNVKVWRSKIHNFKGRVAHLFILVDAHTRTGLNVVYEGINPEANKKDSEKGNISNYWLDIKGKWFKLKNLGPALWMAFAESYIDTYEDKTSASNPVIKTWIDNHNQDYGLEGENRPIMTDNEPWCGVFVYNMLRLAGVTIERGNGWEYPAKASFYKNNWSNSYKINQPVFGAIAKMNWSHVTFIYKFDDTSIWVLGGNQAKDGAAVKDDVMVNIVKYRRNQVQEY